MYDTEYIYQFRFIWTDGAKVQSDAVQQCGVLDKISEMKSFILCNWVL